MSCSRLKNDTATFAVRDIDYTGGGDIILEDLIEDEQVVVNLSHQGLIKRTSAT